MISFIIINSNNYHKLQKKGIEKKSDKIVSKHIQKNPTYSFNFDNFKILDLEKINKKDLCLKCCLLKNMKKVR